MHYTLLQGHGLLRGTSPFLQPWSFVRPYLSPICLSFILYSIINDVSFVISFKVSKSCRLWRRYTITLMCLYAPSLHSFLGDKTGTLPRMEQVVVLSLARLMVMLKLETVAAAVEAAVGFQAKYSLFFCLRQSELHPCRTSSPDVGL